MLHIRFTSLVFGLLFLLHALKSCAVQAHQGGDQAFSDQETVVSVPKELGYGTFGGRKLRGHEVVAATSKNSGANRSDGKSWNQNTSSSDRHPKVKIADFVALSDYSPSKRGPAPINN